MDIAFCDDDKQEWQKIGAYLEKMRHSVMMYATMEELLSAIDAGGHFDLLLLDIEIPGGMNGLEAAQYVRNKDKDVMIIFMTQHATQVWNAFSVEVMDFLIKPIDEKKLQAAIRRCENKYENCNRLVFSYNFAEPGNPREMITLLSKDIYYMAAQKNYCLIYHRLSPEPFKMRITMGKLAKELKPFVHLYHCQKGYIINWQYVLKLYRDKDYSCWARLKDGPWEETVPLSRLKWQEATQIFHQYHRGEL